MMSNDDISDKSVKTVQALVVDEGDLLPVSDISEENNKKIQAFIENGLPGITKVDDLKLSKMMDLYLSGRTYEQISNATRIDKVTVMYLSQKLDWCKTRQAYLMELEEGMKKRIIENKLVSQDFMLQLVQMWHKKIGRKMAKYLATDNDEHAEGIDLKEIDRYLKVLEKLSEAVAPPKSDKAPAVGLNLGDGVTITKKGDNEVEITPKAKAVSDMLQQYADMRREEDKKRK